MTIMNASRHTDISTTDYYTERKLHHCVTDVRRQYPIAPLFRGDLAHAQTMCTRLSPQPPERGGGEPGWKLVRDLATRVCHDFHQRRQVGECVDTGYKQIQPTETVEL